MGGRDTTQEFFRLFMIPGMNHCNGGIGAYTIDYLSYLEAWVEERKAPDQLIGAHVQDSHLAALPLPSWLQALLPEDVSEQLHIAAAASVVKLPLDPSVPVTFTRPMYPYPSYAHYVGGDPSRAESFRVAQ